MVCRAICQVMVYDSALHQKSIFAITLTPAMGSPALRRYRRVSEREHSEVVAPEKFRDDAGAALRARGRLKLELSKHLFPETA
jgi:hypothetical protein